MADGEVGTVETGAVPPVGAGALGVVTEAGAGAAPGGLRGAGTGVGETGGVPPAGAGALGAVTKAGAGAAPGGLSGAGTGVGETGGVPGGFNSLGEAPVRGFSGAGADGTAGTPWGLGGAAEGVAAGVGPEGIGGMDGLIGAGDPDETPAAAPAAGTGLGGNFSGGSLTGAPGFGEGFPEGLGEAGGVEGVSLTMLENGSIIKRPPQRCVNHAPLGIRREPPIRRSISLSRPCRPHPLDLRGEILEDIKRLTLDGIRHIDGALLLFRILAILG